MNNNLETTKARHIINKLDYPLLSYPLVFSLLDIPTDGQFVDYEFLQKHLDEFQVLLSAEAELTEFVQDQSRLIKQTLLSLIDSDLIYDPFISETFNTLSNVDKVKTTALYNSDLKLFENAKSKSDFLINHTAFRLDGSSYETYQLPVKNGIVYQIKSNVGDTFDFLIKLDVMSIKDATLYYEVLDNYKNKVEVLAVDLDGQQHPQVLEAGINLNDFVSIDIVFRLEKPSDISKSVSYFVCGLKKYFILKNEFESSSLYTNPYTIKPKYTTFSIDLDSNKVESYYSLFSDQTKDWTAWTSFESKDRIYTNERKTLTNSAAITQQVTAPIKDSYTNKNLIKILYDIDNVDFSGLYTKSSNEYYADIEECLLLIGVGYLASGSSDTEELGWTKADNGYITYFKPHYDFAQEFNRPVYINNSLVTGKYQFEKDNIYKINILESNWKPVYKTGSTFSDIDPVYPNNQKYIFQGRVEDTKSYPQKGIIFNNLGRYVPYDILALSSVGSVFSLTVNERDKINFCIPKKENYALYGKERCVFWLPIYKKNTNPTQIKFKFVLDSQDSFVNSYTVKVK